jgi:hypothetical protein
MSISTSKEELKVIIAKINLQFKNNFKHLKGEYLGRFEKILEQLVMKMRETFSLRLHKGKKRTYFECLLKNLSPLPPNYKTLKQKTYAFIKSNKDSCD